MIRRPGVVLALLTALNFLNYLDRMILSAVLPAIQSELHLSSFVAGLLSTVFLVGYFLTAPVFGTLGDRGHRKWLIASGVFVWSLATFASGVAQGTLSLVVARALVGVGEASYATIAPTLIDDLAPPEKRGKWLAIFYSAIPIGSALGYVVGGLLERYSNWRAPFLIAGGPGFLLAFVCLFVVEPARASVKERPRILDSLGKLWRSRLYVRGVAGYAAFTFALGGFSFWAPSFLFRRYQMPLLSANVVFGAITVVTGIVGTAIGGMLADIAARPAPPTTRESPEGFPYRAPARTTEWPDAAERDRLAVLGYLKVCAMGAAAGAPLAALALLSPGPRGFFAGTFLCELALFITTSPINAVILRSVPTALRASAMALSIFAIHLFGDLWSPPLVGYLSDLWPMQWAMMLIPAAVVVSALSWWPSGAARRPDPTNIPGK